MDERCGTCKWQRPGKPCKETRKERSKRVPGDYDWCAAWKAKRK